MRFLVVGLGSIGIRHARNLLAMGHEVYGYDPEPHGYRALPIEEGDIRDGWDGVIIASPTSTHWRWLDDAVDYGHNTFVEKPIAANIDGIGDILASAKSRGVVVMVGNMLRFHPNVILAKQYIQDPVSAIFRVKQKNTKYTDDVILNWGAHEIDLATYLLGPAAVAGAFGSKDQATVTLMHDSGVESKIFMDYLTEPEIRNFTVECRGGETHDINLTLHDWNDIYMAEMQAFIDRIEREEALGATGEEGLEVLKLINDAQRMAGLL